jgi:glycosyltransferase involved in cell wall biosynthesis
MKLNDEVMVVFPREGKSSSGGPEGFVTQLMRSFSHDRFGVTIPVDVKLSRRWKGLIAPSSNIWNSTVLLKAPLNRNLLRGELIARESGMTKAKYLWFMYADVFAWCEPFIRKDQIIIYQPHCPVLPWEEVEGSDTIAQLGRLRVESEVRRLFKRAHTLVFPNKGAQSIYSTLLNTAHDIRYIQSGAACPATHTPFPLDPTLTYLLYIGRRLPVKGYDLIVQAFAQAIKVRPDLRLIVCGHGEPIHAPGVIDVGFTSRIHDWIASVDCVVNANRQSYLDLSVMETLAIGTPLIMTATHGHEIFSNWQSPGLRCIHKPEVDFLVESFIQVSSLVCRLPATRSHNLALYDREFSVTAYQRRLTGFLDELFPTS